MSTTVTRVMFGASMWVLRPDPARAIMPIVAIARQAVPRGTPCEYCGKPIRTGGHPKG